MNSGDCIPLEVDELSTGPITVVFTHGSGSRILAERIILLVQAAAESETREICAVNVIITNDNYLQDLNREYKHIEQATDVLSFNLAEPGNSQIEGDIYISLDRAGLQAKERNDKTETEVLRLTIHGFLHLCGWLHDDDVSLRTMMDRGESKLRTVITAGR